MHGFVAMEATGLSAITSALKTSFSDVASSVMGVIGDTLPIVLPIIGAMVVIGTGVKIFKKLSSKS